MILAASECISKILTFAAFAYLARLLGPEGYGRIEFALAAIFIFQQLVDFGFEKYGAVAVAKNKSFAPKLAAHIVVLRLGLAVGTSALLAVFVGLMEEPWPVKQLVLLYGLTLFGIPGLLQWIFQGLERMHWVALASIARQLVFALGVFLWIHEPEQLLGVAVIEVVALGFTVVFNYLVFRSNFGPLRLHLEAGFSRSLIRQAMPIFLSQMMMALKLHLPTIILAMMASNEEVGWFRTAHRVVFALNTFVALYLFNLLPSIARSSQRNSENLDRMMNTSLRISAWSAVFVGAFGTALAAPLISNIYGSQYAAAANVLCVMIWLIVIFLLSGHYRYILIGLGKQKSDLTAMALGVGASIVLSFLLIPKYHMLGAAWAMLAAELLTWGFAYYFVRREIMIIPILRHLVKPLVAGITMLVILRLLPEFNHWVLGSTAVVLYLFALLMLQPSLFADIRSWGIGNK